MTDFSAFSMYFWNTNVIIILVIFVATIFVSKIIKVLLHRASKLSGIDPTHYKFMRHFLSAVVYLVGFSIIIYMIPPLRALSVSLLAGAGILVVVIGFASQQAFSNLVSGIFIIVSKPYRVGDTIIMREGSIRGAVEDITLRHTVIRTFKNKRVIIPNSVMDNEVIENAHFEDTKICKWLDLGISYDSDMGKAMKIMQSEAEKHPDCLDNRSFEQKHSKKPIVNTKVVGFGDSSVNLRAWVWAKDPGTGFRIGCDLRKSIKERFDREGIEIPYPYRTIVYKKDMKKKRK